MRCLWTRRVNVSTCSHEQLAHTKTDAKPEGKRWQTDARKKKKKKEEKGEDSFKLHLRPNVAFPSVRELLLVVTKELWSLVSK